MAYNNKYVSVESIIDKVYRDSGIKNIDWDSAIEWTAELLGIVGIPCINVDKVTNGKFGWPTPVRVEEYRFRLPEDMVTLTGIRRAYLDNNGEVVGYSPMIESYDIYHDENLADINKGPTSFDPIFTAPVVGGDQDNLEMNIITVEGETTVPNGYVEFKYKLDANIGFTDFKDGYVEIAYTGIPIDERGLPVVPDDPKFLEALKYHLIFKIDWREWRKNPASPGLRALVNDSEQRRDFYVGAAITKAKMPSLDKMEAIKNQWLRTIPKINEHANSFKTLGRAEQRYNILSIPNKGR